MYKVLRSCARISFNRNAVDFTEHNPVPTNMSALPPTSEVRRTSGVISVSDDEGSGIDEAPLRSDNITRHAPSVQFEEPKSRSPVRLVHRTTSRSLPTRSRTPRNTVHTCSFDDDHGEIHPANIPGKVNKAPARAGRRYLLSATTAGAASQPFSNEDNTSLNQCDRRTFSQGGNQSLHQTHGRTPSPISSTAKGRIGTSSHASMTIRGSRSSPRTRKTSRESLHTSRNTISDTEKFQTQKRPRKNNILPQSIIADSAQFIKSSCNSFGDENERNSAPAYNEKSVRSDRARRDRSVIDIDNENFHAADPVEDIVRSVLPTAHVNSVSAVDAVAGDISSTERIPRRSQRNVIRPKEALHGITNEQQRAPPELVELDASNEIHRQIDLSDEQYTGPTYVMFVFPPGERGSITVTAEEHGRLKERKYLNDSLIDFYIKYLETRLQRQARIPDNVPLFFSSFFFRRMVPKDRLSSKEHIDYCGVKSWTKNIDIFKRKYVFIPICDSSHWSLVIIVNLHCFEDIMRNGADSVEPNERPKIIYMDSLDPDRGTAFGNIVIHYLTEEFHHRKVRNKSESISQNDLFKRISKIMKVHKPRVPLQSNEYDCGLYLLQCLQMFLFDGYFQHNVKNNVESLDKSFSHTDIEQLRMDICDLMNRLEQSWKSKTAVVSKSDPGRTGMEHSKNVLTSSLPAPSTEDELRNVSQHGRKIGVQEFRARAWGGTHRHQNEFDVNMEENRISPKNSRLDKMTGDHDMVNLTKVCGSSGSSTGDDPDECSKGAVEVSKTVRVPTTTPEGMDFVEDSQGYDGPESIGVDERTPELHTTARDGRNEAKEEVDRAAPSLSEVYHKTDHSELNSNDILVVETEGHVMGKDRKVLAKGVDIQPKNGSSVSSVASDDNESIDAAKADFGIAIDVDAEVRFPTGDEKWKVGDQLGGTSALSSEKRLESSGSENEKNSFANHSHSMELVHIPDDASKEPEIEGIGLPVNGTPSNQSTPEKALSTAEQDNGFLQDNSIVIEIRTGAPTNGSMQGQTGKPYECEEAIPMMAEETEGHRKRIQSNRWRPRDDVEVRPGDIEQNLSDGLVSTIQDEQDAKIFAHPDAVVDLRDSDSEPSAED